MNGDNSQGGGAAPASPASKRKPVPTPRSTLRKPALDKEEQLRKKLIINGIDSQVSWESSNQYSDIVFLPQK